MTDWRFFFPLPLPAWIARALPLWWKRRRVKRFMNLVLDTV
jgi:hypothetical protein